MVKRRPHWDDTLVEAVAAVINQADVDDYANVHFTHSDIYKIIAAVEDWHRDHATLSVVYGRAERAEAAIQDAREVCEQDTRYPGGYHDGWHAAMRSVLRALDGPS
ncbi:MAG: hypothetical protein R2686_06965 [Candidatus Nanopelagicales bacterium]